MSDMSEELLNPVFVKALEDRDDDGRSLIKAAASSFLQSQMKQKSVASQILPIEEIHPLSEGEHRGVQYATYTDLDYPYRIILTDDEGDVTYIDLKDPPYPASEAFDNILEWSPVVTYDLRSQYAKPCKERDFTDIRLSKQEVASVAFEDIKAHWFFHGR